jgi:hypothetical protein
VDVEIVPTPHAPERYDLVIRRNTSEGPSHHAWAISSLTEHDLSDLAWVLAHRKTMTRHCDAKNGEHTCGLLPGHPPVLSGKGEKHVCRSCWEEWK